MILRAPLRIVFKGALDRREQLLLRDRFGQEIFRACLDGAHAGRNIAMTGHEDDWKRVSEFCEAILQLRPA